MPFKKVGNDDYTSPSGRHFNGAQVRLWYAQGGKFPGEKHAEGKMGYAKGGDVHSTSYAAGGPVLGRTVDFMKTPDEFREADEGERKSADVVGDTSDEDQKYAKSGEGAGKGFTKPPKQASKSLKAVKPRS